MASQGIVMQAQTTPATPGSGYVSLFPDSTDNKWKHIDPSGNITGPPRGMQQMNLLDNGGLAIQQRVATAATNIASVSTTSRAGVVADRWAVTVGNVTTPQWAQIDTIAAVETGLTARYYGKIIQNTNAAKFIFSQMIEGRVTAALRGKKVRLSVNIKQFAGSNAAYRLGLLQLNSSGTVDTPPAFISAIGGASTEPTWGTNIAAITPDASPTGTNGTISGAALTITSTAAWVTSSCVFTVPSNCVNLYWVLYRDTLGAASDALGIAECQLTQGTEIVDFVELPIVTEQERSQRFFSKSFPQTVVPAASLSEATAGSGITGISGKTTTAALAAQISIQFPVPMRIAPTVTLFTPTASGAQVWRFSGAAAAAFTATAVRTNSTTDRGCVVGATGDASNAVGDLVGVHYTADAEFTA